jgi:hypothetical protein
MTCLRDRDSFGGLIVEGGMRRTACKDVAGAMKDTVARARYQSR